MRDSIRASIERVAKMAFDFSAPTSGDQMFHVCGKTGVRTSVLSIQWTNFRDNAEGVEAYGMGMEAQEERLVVFLRSYLEASGITSIAPDDWFEILGKRWDLSIGEPIIVATGPSGATSPEIRVMLRQATERDHTKDVSEFGFDLT